MKTLTYIIGMVLLSAHAVCAQETTRILSPYLQVGWTGLSSKESAATNIHHQIGSKLMPTFGVAARLNRGDLRYSGNLSMKIIQFSTPTINGIPRVDTGEIYTFNLMSSAQYRIDDRVYLGARLKGMQRLDYSFDKTGAIGFNKNLLISIGQLLDWSFLKMEKQELGLEIEGYYFFGMQNFQNGFGYLANLSLQRQINDRMHLKGLVQWEQTFEETSFVHINQKELVVGLEYGMGF